MAGDAVWALFVAPFVVIGLAETPAWGPDFEPLASLVGIALLLVPMLWRRRHPDILAVCVAVIHLGQVVVIDRPAVFNVIVPVALYAVAAYSRWRYYRAWFAVALVGCVLAGVDWAHTGSGANVVVAFLTTTFFCTAVVAASWVSGELARQRRRNVEALRERAEALERERDQRTQLATQQERSRIAREMHDVVAHNLSVIVVQADGAHYAATHGGDPAQRAETAARALQTIAETAREALTETRRLVGVLRSEGAEAEYAPQASLAQLPEVVARMSQAGLPATYAESGDPHAHPPLSQGAEMAAYRVVQESLTNVVKHAGPGVAVQVTLEHRPDGIALAIRDDGPGSGGGAGADGQGHGLIGMRERVATYGGSLVARDRMAGGFEVLASIPAADRPPGSGGSGGGSGGSGGGSGGSGGGGVDGTGRREGAGTQLGEDRHG